MTPEQTEAIKRAKQAAAIERARQRMTHSQSAPGSAQEPSMAGFASQALSGAHEGVAGFLGLPVDLADKRTELIRSMMGKPASAMGESIGSSDALTGLMTDVGLIGTEKLDEQRVSTILTESIKTGSQEVALNNISYFHCAGLLALDEKIAKNLKACDEVQTPVLPTETSVELEQFGFFADASRCEQGAFQPSRLQRADNKLRLVSWNLENFRPYADDEQRLYWASCLIAWMNADLVAVQELRRERLFSSITKIERALAEVSGNSWSVIIDECQSHVGLAYFVNESFVSEEWRRTYDWLAPNGDCSQLRGGFGVLISPKENDAAVRQSMLVVNVHFDAGKSQRDYDNRASQFRSIERIGRLEEFAEASERAIVLGDCNTAGRAGTRGNLAVSEDDEIRGLDEMLKDFDPPFDLITRDIGPTWLSTGADGNIRFRARLDHIALSEKVKREHGSVAVRRMGHCLEDTPLTAEEIQFATEGLSDHCPVVVDIEW